MVAQAARTESRNSLKDGQNEIPRQPGALTIFEPSRSPDSFWSHWTNLLSQLNPTGIPMMKSAEELMQAGKEAIEAMAKSSTAFAEGCGDIGKHIMTATHQSVANHIASSKEIYGIKTPGDWMDVHSKQTMDWMTSAITQISHLSQLSTKTVDQACEPLKAHFSDKIRKMQETAKSGF